MLVVPSWVDREALLLLLLLAIACMLCTRSSSQAPHSDARARRLEEAKVKRPSTGSPHLVYHALSMPSDEVIRLGLSRTEAEAREPGWPRPMPRVGTNEKIDQLRCALPACSSDHLRQVLQEHGGDLRRSISAARGSAGPPSATMI